MRKSRLGLIVLALSPMVQFEIGACPLWRVTKGLWLSLLLGRVQFSLTAIYVVLAQDGHRVVRMDLMRLEVYQS
jgi:hypothetical protein